MLPSVVRAALWMTGTLISFVSMAIAVRQLAPHMSVFEMMFFRGVVGVAVLLPVVHRDLGSAFASGRPALQIIRNVVLFAAVYGWTLAIVLLPLVEVIALEFTSPIWVTLLATFLLGERLNLARVVAVAGGFTGTLVILRPGVAVFDPAALLALGAAFGFATAIVITKVLTRSDSTMSILVYMTMVQLPLGFIFAVPQWTTPTPADIPWILVIGVTALSAQYTMARALKIADASVIQPIDFLRVPLMAVVGIVLYAEVSDPLVLAGAVIIFGANYYMVWRESRSADSAAGPRAAT